MNKTPELLPCPFCGGKAELLEDVLDAHVYCTECYARTTDTEKFVKDWKREVIRIWNTRVYPKDVQEAVERDKPKAPIVKTSKYGKNYFCPTCDNDVSETYDCCSACGQRLDWSEE